MNLTIDRSITPPEISITINEVCEFVKNNRMMLNDSFFIEDYPVAHLAPLATALVMYNLIPIYTTNDELFGSEGVRVFVMSKIKTPTETVANNHVDKWIERANKWFNNNLSNMDFAWNKKDKKIVVYDKSKEPTPDGCYEVTKQNAFTFMTPEGEHYRNGKKEPLTIEESNQFHQTPQVQVWVGFKQVTWGYDVKLDKVVQFNDGSYKENIEGRKGEWEEAPLHAYLAYMASLEFNKKDETKTDDMECNIDDL